MSLAPVANRLEQLLEEKVLFLNDCLGQNVESACLKSAERIIMLENLRFHIEEEGKCKCKDGTVLVAESNRVAEFGQFLSKLADVYVNDAFGCVHRAHSSITGISIEPRVAGLLVQKELKFFSMILEDSKQLELLILGGAKLSDKIQLIEQMLPKTKRIMIGGGMAFTFLSKISGIRIGKSLYDAEGAAIIPAIMEKAKALNVDIILPHDFVVSSEFSEDGGHQKLVLAESGIDDNDFGLDIGPESSKYFGEIISNIKGDDKVILWNGPMGVFYWEKYSNGTRCVLEALAATTETNHTVTVVGGGDSSAAVAKWHFENRLSHVSTGGGASLELLEGIFIR